MSKAVPQDKISDNLLLASLTAKDRRRILAISEPVEMNFGTVVYRPGDAIENVYFMLDGIVSLLSTIDNLSMLEVGMVGKEGFAGLPVFLGVNTSANQAIVQGQGTALKIETPAFLEECQRSVDFNRILKRYTHYRLTQASLTAACNRFHKVGARLARWLLMTHDRMAADEFQITQKFLSHMLGVRREAVTIAAQPLQEKGLIKYSRGNLSILDRSALKGISCECYRLICEEENRVFE